MPDQMPEVYEGDRPYAFVSYAHADRRAVLPIIGALVAQGHRVWYDDGIELATNYPDYIADHVYGCAVFLMFISRASNASRWCRNEANYALALGKPILPIYLQKVELRRGLQMQLGATQSMYCTDYSSRDVFCRELFKAEVLRACLTAEGTSQLGADPWGDLSSAGARVAHPQVVDVRQERKSLTSVSDVAMRAALAEYTWAELKKISRAIAAAGSNAEWLGIAKAYDLVDKVGLLQGDKKPLTLKDGTEAAVRILGFRQDELSENKGKAGISFEFAGVPKTHWMNADWTNEGGWEKSEMRNWLRSDFWALLPDELRANLVEVTKRTNNRGKVSQSDSNAVTDTRDKLWLLSTAEVYGGDLEYPYGAEGKQYQLYIDQDVTTENYDFSRKSGASSWWWLRSPYARDSSPFRIVSSGGGWLGRLADGDDGVSPGFCF